MPSKAEIQAQIDALTADLQAAGDEDDDFEIEIFSDGKGARLPFSKGKSWLEANLGLDFGPAAPPAGDGGTDPNGQNGNGTGQRAAGKKQQQQDPANPPAPRSYFGGGKR